jgi:hypothetical protein
MNMISTGAFQTEMDASEKQETIATKFVKAWEKKNARVARAGGVSLAALSLAACGSDDATSTTTTTTTTPTTTTTTTTTPASQSLSLTATVAGDDLVGGAGDDTFTGGSAARFQNADVLTGGAGTDTLNTKITGDVTATIDEIETLIFDAIAASSVQGSSISAEATSVTVTGGNAFTYKNAVQESFTVSEVGSGLTVTANSGFTDSATNSISLTIGAGALGTMTLGDAGESNADGYDYELVNIALTGDGSSTLTEADNGADQTDDGWFATGEKITVTGTGDYTFNIAGALLGANTATGTAVAAVVDASAHTGALTIDIGQLGANDFFEASKLTGVDTIRLSTGSSDDDDIQNIMTGTSVYVDGIENADNELALDPLGTGVSDVMNLTLAHATAATAIDLTALVLDGYETTNIVSGGTNSATVTVVNVLDDVAGLSTDTTLNISGDIALTATGIENTFTTITSTNTAGANLTVDSGGALTFTGGAGPDRLELDTVADLTAADSLTGGSSTGDTLAFSAVPSALSALQLGYFSGFEKIEFEATNIVAASFTLDVDAEAVTTVIFTGELTTAATKIMTINAVSGLRIEMAGHTAGGSADDLNIVIENAANAGTNDTVTLDLANTGANDANAGLQIDNVENFIVELSGDASHTWTLSDVDGAQVQSVSVVSTNTTAATASDALTITGIESTIVTVVDMSAMTGTTDVSGLGAALSGAGATITGGSGADTITGGAGADTINSGAGADIIVGGGGNDAITSGEGADTITPGLGSDTITLTESTKAIDTIVGTTSGAQALTTIIGFDVQSAAERGDNYDIDLSDFNGIVTELRSGDGTDLTTATDPLLTTITAAYDLGGANSDILVLSGDFANTGAVETALESGGSRALLSDDTNTEYASGDAFLVLYDDGTDSYLAAVAFATDPGTNANFASGDMTATNYVKFTGISDATTFVSNNFDIVT